MSTCRACEKNILAGNKFCPFCGWLNAKIEVESQINSNMPDNNSIGTEFIEDIIINHTGAAHVKAKLSIKNNDFIYFNSDEKQTTKEIIISENTKIPIAFKPTSMEDYKNIDFILEIVSTDEFGPDPRPYSKKDYLKTSRVNINVYLHEPKKLKLHNDIIILNKSKRSASFYVSNPGERDIQITKVKPDDPNFTINPQNATIAKKDHSKFEISFMGENFPQKYHFSKVEIVYTIGGKEFNDDVCVCVYKQEDDKDAFGYDYIVSIDFGTHKTTGAYLDPTDKDLTIHNLAEEEMPSSIAYDKNGDIWIGTEAESRRYTGEYANRIKKLLCNDTIKFQSDSPEEITRPTVDVLADFLREFKNNYLQDVLNKKNGGGRTSNKYIFTLPILDDSLETDGDGSRYRKQEEITLEAAKRVLQIRENDDIFPLKESKAAVYSIVDIIINRRERFTNIDLNSGDVICIFDYGAGTLDISFGTYSVNDNGKPSFKTIANIGLFKKEKENENNEAEFVELGGDRIDQTMTDKFIKDYGIEFEDDPDIGGEMVVKNSPHYAKVHKMFFPTAMETVKIELSKSWDNAEVKEVPFLPGAWDMDESYLSFPKETFMDIIDEDIYMAMDAMKKVMDKLRSKQIKTKYIFLVGGSSLLKKIKINMKRRFDVDEIYDAYDYGCTKDEREFYEIVNDGDDGNLSEKDLAEKDRIYKKIKYEAVHAVARGAVLSYLTKFEDILNFDIAVESENARYDGIKNILGLKKGSAIPTAMNSTTLNKMASDKYIFNLIGKNISGKDRNLGRAIIDTTSFPEYSDVETAIFINDEHKLCLGYKLANKKDDKYIWTNEFDADIII